VARFSAPYQYSQPHYIDRILQKLWLVNILARNILNKVSFGVLPPPMIMMTMDKKLTYRQMARKGDTGTAVTVLVLAGVLLKLVKKYVFASSPIMI